MRERRLESCPLEAWALYLFLVTVGDAQGLSYYSDASLTARVPLDRHELRHARSALIVAGLIAFEPPLYQVLSLDDAPTTPTQRRNAPARRLSEVLQPDRDRAGALIARAQSHVHDIGSELLKRPHRLASHDGADREHGAHRGHADHDPDQRQDRALLRGEQASACLLQIRPTDRPHRPTLVQTAPSGARAALRLAAAADVGIAPRPRGRA